MSEGISFCRQLKKEDLTVREAGRLGGLAVLLKHGKCHLAEIGRKGQEATRTKYPGMASVWGKMGGRPKKFNLNLDMGERG
jgi:general stress protein YciG